jgi:hypothetical protein
MAWERGCGLIVFAAEAVGAEVMRAVYLTFDCVKGVHT